MIVEIYTEYTPNPESLKFVMQSKMLLPNNSADFRTAEEAEKSPLATALFENEFVEGVFIANNFVTITKNPSYTWETIIPKVKTFLKDFVIQGKEVIKEGADLNANNGVAGDDIEAKIISLLDKYVKPAVEMDGGAIQFRSFEDGVVTLTMQGSCSGCPSSTVTLKNGIEGLLKRMVPEVKEVVAEADAIA